MMYETMTLERVKVVKSGIENLIRSESVQIDRTEKLNVETNISFYAPQVIDNEFVVDIELSIKAQIASVDMHMRGIYHSEDDLQALPNDRDWEIFLSRQVVSDILPYVRVYVSQLCGMVDIPAIPLVLKNPESMTTGAHA
ncbi:hypothetical protein JTE88_00580 [Arcanobacterium phocisimile]|uniref:Preprotein translocase subunit SecB n=1 Tax=Arcanobacterium phocisimile TaxID=1302235 RepID=A0ABX7IGP6_9ACTO|nr:hypothetical protein [Arcanobacterium phocisimile]QRV02293.1 hypothetical protein JTE88_00580 [Arcanobacterium phocisimile]